MLSNISQRVLQKDLKKKIQISLGYVLLTSPSLLKVNNTAWCNKD